MKTIPTVEEVAIALLELPRNGGWTRPAAYAVAQHLVEKAKETGQDVDFDPESIDRDFMEWPTLSEWADAYFRDDLHKLGIGADDSPEDQDEMIRGFIESEGTLIEVHEGPPGRYPCSFVISNDIPL